MSQQLHQDTAGPQCDVAEAAGARAVLFATVALTMLAFSPAVLRYVW